MASLTRRFALALILGTLAICAVESTAAEDKVPGVGAIMKKVNDTKRGANKGLTSKITEAANNDKWDDAQKMAKELKELGESLGKNKAKKGEADSWKTKCEQYAKETSAITAAVEKKDAKALKDAMTAFNGSCKACHKEHQ